MSQSFSSRMRVGVIAFAWLTATVSTPNGHCFAEDGSPINEKAIELFAGVASGEIEVKFIPKDELQAHVMITNKLDQPISVQLPEVFAGVPALAQRRGGGNNRNGNNSQQQAIGGGMGGRGMGMGIFSIPSEKTRQFDVPTVCLEYGKLTPTPATPYEIVPLDAFTDQPEIVALLSAFANNGLDQQATQAAVWHLANGVAWDELAVKQYVNDDFTTGNWFSQQELAAAIRLATEAKIYAEVHESQNEDHKSDNGDNRLRYGQPVSTETHSAGEAPPESERLDADR